MNQHLENQKLSKNTDPPQKEPLIFLHATVGHTSFPLDTILACDRMLFLCLGWHSRCGGGGTESATLLRVCWVTGPEMAPSHMSFNSIPAITVLPK